jgi:glycine cleavage system H protein
MNIPSELAYSTDHEWVRIVGTRATIGITDYAQDALGDVVYVQVPTAGRVVALGEVFSEVESTKSVSDIFAPVTGTIVEVNELLAEGPDTLNTDPYGEGWICVIDMSNPDEATSLLSAEAYSALVDG